jgi:hypothetical protein
LTTHAAIWARDDSCSLLSQVTRDGCSSQRSTVMGGGRFDGIIGVLGGIEVARCLMDSAIEPEHPIEVIVFLAEEPSEFGISTVGSRALCGSLTPETLSRVNAAGTSLADAIAFVGGRPTDSHCAEEWTDLADVALGTQVLGEAVLQSDRSGHPRDRLLELRGREAGRVSTPLRKTRLNSSARASGAMSPPGRYQKIVQFSRFSRANVRWRAGMSEAIEPSPWAAASVSRTNAS